MVVIVFFMLFLVFISLFPDPVDVLIVSWFSSVKKWIKSLTSKRNYFSVCRINKLNPVTLPIEKNGFLLYQIIRLRSCLTHHINLLLIYQHLYTHRSIFHLILII